MATVKTDVVIVGVGAAGGVIAAELAKAGMWRKKGDPLFPEHKPLSLWCRMLPLLRPFRGELFPGSRGSCVRTTITPQPF
jgi:hypothetical protein